jgi:FkbM family methyltransferase
MRIFVDVGAHNGETLHVALDPKWGFDRVFALEPASACQRALRGFKDPKLTIQPVGLGKESTNVRLHGAGLLGASIYPEKEQRVGAETLVSTEDIELVRATDWFRSNIPRQAEVFLKLNCEGSECDILSDLLDSGSTGQIQSIYVDFDIRKVPGQAHRQAEVEQRLQQCGTEYVTPEALACNGHIGVAKWLATTIPAAPRAFSERLRYALRLYASPYERLRQVAAALLPQKLYFWIGRKFGRVARSRRQA